MSELVAKPIAMAGLIGGFRKRSTSPTKPVFARERACDHLFEDLPANTLVGERSLMPPPAVLLHLRGRRDEALGHLGEISVGIVQAEDQPSGTDPAQGDPFAAKVVLQHPVVAGRLGVMD